MNLRRFYPVAIAAASLACQATSLYAQTTRSRQNPDGTITSLTNRNRPQRDSTSLGRVEDGVDLSLSVPGVNLEAGNEDLIGSGPRRVVLQGASSSAKFAQTRDSQNLAGSRASTQQPWRNAFSSFGPNLPYSPLHVPDRQQTLKRALIERTSGLQPGKRGSDTLSGESTNLHEVGDYGKVSRIKAFTNDYDTTNPIQAGQIPFERLTDPILEHLNDNFEGFHKKLDMEQACGDACSVLSPGRIESFGSATPDHLTTRRNIGVLIPLRPSTVPDRER